MLTNEKMTLSLSGSTKRTFTQKRKGIVRNGRKASSCFAVLRPKSYSLKPIRTNCGTGILIRPMICLSFAGYVKEPWPGQTEQVQRYFCPRCCSSFSKKANMLTHFRYECGKEPRFQCPYCGKRDRKSSNTYRHIRTYHKGRGLPHYAAVLDTLRANMEQKRRRTAVKNENGVCWDFGKMSYHCPICNAGYTYKKTLRTHMKYDCGKEPRFKCPYCNKRDKCSSNIYKHIRMRHDGMPVIVHRN
ncbi:hypothetical protein K0M31_008832 [Melipona bicolor]|uniref:C2H2-type domain-containing protein n=1 Tax=Melipona bicolor TaxID=60889 RepID=A0AA40FPX2_9HYME|nr:hypothetical protein K0M31_008832 [Melipona bicolor]